MTEEPNIRTLLEFKAIGETTVYTLLFKFVTNEKKKNAKVKSIHNCFLPFDSITIFRKDFRGQPR